MYIITDANITYLSINSNYYEGGYEESINLFLERISEHCYSYYNIKLNINIGDILSENIYIIDHNFYLQKNNTEEDILEVFLYKKTINKGFIFNTYEFKVYSIFQLKFEIDSLKTTEYIKII